MRSGTSFFDRTVFGKTFLRFWPIWVVNLVLWAILLPLSGLMILTSGSSQTIMNYAQNISDFTEPALVAAVVLSPLTAMAVFSHLYSTRSANFFGALPIRREGLFLSHYFAGLAMLWLPNLAVAALTTLVELAGGALEPLPILVWLAMACGAELFFYSFAVFCGMFTGHILALPAFYIIFNSLASFIYMIVQYIMEEFYYGFYILWSSAGTARLLLTPVEALSRVGFWFMSSTQSYHSEGLLYLAGYSAAGVVLAVLSFFLYRARRLESAGDVVAVRPMRPVFQYGVAVCSGLFFGYLTAIVLTLGEVGLMLSILLWAVAGYFVARMLLDKTFRVFRRWKGAAALAAVFCLMFAVIGMDLTGFETRVPDPDSVTSVVVEGLNAVDLDDYGDWYHLELTDPEQIRLITSLHQAAVDQRDLSADRRGPTTTFTLTYHLRSGGTLYRHYSSIPLDPAQADQEGTASWAIEQIYADRALTWRCYQFDLLHDLLEKGGRLTEVQLLQNDYYTGDWQMYDQYYGTEDAIAEPEYVKGAEYYYYGDDAQAVLDAVEEDFWADRIGFRTLRMLPTSESEYISHAGEWYLYFTVESFSGTEKTDVQSVSIALSDQASQTRAVLEELGWESQK